MTISQEQLPVDTELYVSKEGFVFVKEFHEDLADYCFTSKVRVVDSWEDIDDNGVMYYYECVFVNDPYKRIVEFTDVELSFTPLHYFNTLPDQLPPSTPMEIYSHIGDATAKGSEEIGRAMQRVGQIEFVIDNDELVVPIEEVMLQTYEKQGQALGALVDRKQKAYGNAVERGNEVMKVLLKSYYNEQNKTYEIPEELLLHLQIIIRTLDKFNRIVNNPKQDLMEENTYNDIVGYALLGSSLSGR